MPLRSPPVREAAQTAFRLSIEGQLALLTPGNDPLGELDSIHERLGRMLETAPISAPDLVEETRYRAFLAAQLAAAVDELRVKLGGQAKRLAS